MFPISLCCFDEKKTQIRLNKLLFSLVQPSDVHSPWHKGLGGGGRGGIGTPSSSFFYMLQYLEKILPSVESF